MFGNSVNPVNVDLVEPICEGFGCSAGTVGTDMAGVVVAVGENCDLMYGSEVWGIVQGAYAQYALATCSLTTLKPFLLSLGKVGTIPIVGRDQLAVSAGSGRSLDLETHGRRDGWPVWHWFHWNPTGQSSRRGNCDYRGKGEDGIDFVNGLGADVVVDYHEQNIRYPGQ